MLFDKNNIILTTWIRNWHNIIQVLKILNPASYTQWKHPKLMKGKIQTLSIEERLIQFVVSRPTLMEWLKEIC